MSDMNTTFCNYCSKGKYLVSPYSSFQTGFTLVEVLVVMALVAILSAFAAPQINQMTSGIKVNSASRQIASEMMLLKRRSVSENRKYRIVFGSPAANQYKVQQDGNRDNDYSDSVDTIVKTETLPEGIIFGTNALKVATGESMCSDAICFGSDNGASFKPTGSADSGSVYIIPVEDKATGRTGRMRGISISSVGRIRIWRYVGGGSMSWIN